MSRVCEEFYCAPSVAQFELDENPQLVLDILELRAFARAKETMDRDKENVVLTPMVKLVMKIEASLMFSRGQDGRRDP